MMKSRENKREKKNNNPELKRAKGITLIALVITIIVLLILAGVTIASLTGENGILSKATQASAQTEISGEKEAISLAYTGALSEKLGEGTVTADDMNTQFEKNDTNADASGSIKVHFTESGRWYKVDKKGNITGPYTSEDEMGTTLAEAFEAGEIKVGDYVYFENPTTGSYTVDASKVGLYERIDYTNNEQVYEISSDKNQLNWRVLGIEDGKVKLIAGSPLKSNNTVDGDETPYLFMDGAKSYTEGYKELDNICNDLYGSLSLVSEARSLNMGDINEITGITTDEKIKEVNIDAYYGNKQYGDRYSYSNQYTPESWLNGETRTTVTGTVDGYYYSINSKADTDAPSVTLSDTRAFNMLFNNVEYPNGAHYWLASHGVLASSTASITAGFGPGLVSMVDGIARAGTCAKFLSYGDEYGGWAAVRPVVVLNADVTTDEVYKIEDQTETTWNYNMDKFIPV